LTSSGGATLAAQISLIGGHGQFVAAFVFDVAGVAGDIGVDQLVLSD